MRESTNTIDNCLRSTVKKCCCRSSENSYSLIATEVGNKLNGQLNSLIPPTQRQSQSAKHLHNTALRPEVHHEPEHIVGPWCREFHREVVVTAAHLKCHLASIHQHLHNVVQGECHIGLLVVHESIRLRMHITVASNDIFVSFFVLTGDDCSLDGYSAVHHVGLGSNEYFAAISPSWREAVDDSISHSTSVASSSAPRSF